MLAKAKSSGREIKPVAAGCIIKSTDTRKIVISFACFAAFIVYGSCHASLGAAVPMISEVLHEEEGSIGFAFITRGCGFLAATVASALFLSMSNSNVSKDMIICAFTLYIGIVTAFVGFNVNYQYFLMLTILQGVGYGVVDTLANCLLPDIWGIRVQPWMQALHLCYGVGAIFGPLSIGYMGYQLTYYTIAIYSFFPILGMIIFGLMFDAHIKIAVDNVYKSVRTDEDSSVDNIDNPTDISDHKNTKEDTDESDENSQNNISVPLILRILIALFYFVYGGTESSFGGWISVYAMETKVTTDPSQAAYIATAFWLALTVGRISGVFTAIYFSATVMLRFHLFLTAITSILLLFIGGSSLFLCGLISSLMGLAISAVYPLVMTIVSDYGFHMDATSTTMFMIGAVFGEAGLPMVTGLVIEYCGPQGLPYAVVLSTCILIVVYYAIHSIGIDCISNYSSNNNNSSSCSSNGIEIELFNINNSKSTKEDDEIKSRKRLII